MDVLWRNAQLLPQGRTPAGHRHLKFYETWDNLEETFILLDGEMSFRIAEETYDARPGSVLYVPRNVAHSYSNVGDGPARVLFMYSPAGMDGMFGEIGSPGQRGSTPPPLRPEDLVAMAAVADKYGCSFLTD